MNRRTFLGTLVALCGIRKKPSTVRWAIVPWKSIPDATPRHMEIDPATGPDHTAIAVWTQMRQQYALTPNEIRLLLSR
jgi:hypothetical protein